MKTNYPKRMLMLFLAFMCLMMISPNIVEARAITTNKDYLEIGRFQYDNRKSNKDVYMKVVSVGTRTKNPIFGWQQFPAPCLKIKVWNAVTGKTIKTYSISTMVSKTKSVKIKIPKKTYVKFTVDGRSNGLATKNWTHQGYYYIDY